MEKRIRRTKAETEAIKAEAWELLNSGVSVSETARRLNIVAVNLYNWFGDSIKQPKINKAQYNDKIVEMRRAGCTIDEIASSLNLSRNWIKHHGCGEYNPSSKAEAKSKALLQSYGFTFIKYNPGTEKNYGTVIYKCDACGNVNQRSWITLKTNGPSCDICIEREAAIKAEEKLIAQAVQHAERTVLNAAQKVRRNAERAAEREALLQSRIHFVECRECGQTFEAVKSGAVYCSKECARAFTNRQHHKKYSRFGKSWGLSWQNIYKRTNDLTCALCGGQCDVNDYYINDNGVVICGDNYPSIDHIIPAALGGTDTMDNVQIAHRGCNSAKGASSHYKLVNNQIEFVL